MGKYDSINKEGVNSVFRIKWGKAAGLNGIAVELLHKGRRGRDRVVKKSL